jgi:hypothetical protein
MFGTNRAPIVHQDLYYLQTDLNEFSLEPSHLGVPSSASKMISKAMVCSAQTVHLSSIKIVSISKRNEIRFYMTHLT